MKQILFLTFVFLASMHSIANRALYVDGFANILGDENQENQLLQFSQERGINKLLLYELHIVHTNIDLTNPATNQELADFISKAKTQYGILEMGAVGENANFFQNRIVAYNNSRSNALEKFDVFNLEFEFWNAAPTSPGGYYCDTYLAPNGFSCDNDGAFSFFEQEMIAIKNLASASAHPVTAEAYVGWPTTAQCQAIQPIVDKILIHAYVSSPTTAFAYTENRLHDFASNQNSLNVSIIYSSESDFMGPWLEANDIFQAESIYLSDLSSNTASDLAVLNFEGFTYFTYSELLNVVLNASSGIDENESDDFVVYPNPAKDFVIISFDETNSAEDLSITDSHGRIIYEMTIYAGNKELNLDLSSFENGVYFLKIGGKNALILKETLGF